jgi:Cas6b C-terminal domain/Cas6b N-terminal domain
MEGDNFKRLTPMRSLHLCFDLPLERRDIAGFRASVARAAGLEQDLFHNHRAEGGVAYRYPQVMYRSEKGLAAIVGIDEGADAIFDWYARCGGYLLWNDVEHPLRVIQLHLREHALRYHPTPRLYRLAQWLPFNQQHYREWSDLPDLAPRIAALDRLLVAHILTFCRAVNWRLPQRLEASVTTIGASYRTRLMGNDMMAFDLTFRSNLVLPGWIGLGRGVSHGFGVCKPEKKAIRIADIANDE